MTTPCDTRETAAAKTPPALRREGNGRGYPEGAAAPSSGASSVNAGVLAACAEDSAGVTVSADEEPISAQGPGAASCASRSAALSSASFMIAIEGRVVSGKFVSGKTKTPRSRPPHGARQADEVPGPATHQLFFDPAARVRCGLI